MTSLTKKEVECIFRKLDIKKKKSTHHIAGWLTYDGVRLGLIHYSHGRGEIPPPVVHKIRKSLKLDQVEFSQIKSCTMDAENYFQLAVNRFINGEESE